MPHIIAAMMQRCRRYWPDGYIDGPCTIASNELSVEPDSPYCMIEGSRFHNGVWKVDGAKLLGVPDGTPNETFEGRVWSLCPPADFVALADEIEAYAAKNPVTGLQSESFGNYSRTFAGADAMSWVNAFSARVAPYQRMYSDLEEV